MTVRSLYGCLIGLSIFVVGMMPVQVIAAAKLQVRAGQHADYGRIVFDWSQRVTYSFNKQENSVHLNFSSPGNIPLAKIKAQLAPYTKDIKLPKTAKDLRIIFDLQSDAVSQTVKHFRIGNKVVIDIYKPKVQAAAHVAKKAEPVKVQPKADPEQPKVVAAPPQQHVAEAPASAETGNSASNNDVDVTLSKSSIVIRVKWQQATAAALYTRFGVTNLIFDRPKNIDLSSVQKIFENSMALPFASDVHAFKAKDYSGLRLHVSRGQGVALERKGNDWELSIGANAKPHIEEIKPTRVADKSGSGNLTFANSLFTDKKNQSASSLLSRHYGRIFRLQDPDVHDVLHIVPLLKSGFGTKAAVKYVDFSLLATVNGLVMQAHADGVMIDDFGKGFSVKRKAGLRLTLDFEKHQKNADLFASAKAKIPTNNAVLNKPHHREDKHAKDPQSLGEHLGYMPLFDFQRWQAKSPGDDFSKRKQHLLGAVINSPDKFLKNQRRFDMAKFYLASGFADQAFGMLDFIEEEDPGFAKDLFFRALRGASYFMLDKPKEAEKIFSHQDFNGHPEARLWRSAIQASSGKWKGNFEEFGHVPLGYPNNLYEDMVLLKARTALQLGRVKEANLLLKGLKKHGAKKHMQMRYLHGWVALALDRQEKAYQYWQEAAKGKDAWASARARYVLVEQSILDHKMTKEAAIKELEKLQFSWRGDDFEFTVQELLGQLYIDVGKYHHGLSIWRTMVGRFPNNPDADELASKMSKTFAQLHQEGKIDTLPPHQAVAFYEEFKELTPVGKPGYDIVRRLVSRLVQADLLTEASQALHPLVEYRLVGEEKVSEGIRLATIYLMDRKPKDALNALTISALKTGQSLSGDLNAKRHYVKAHALAEVGRGTEGLALLNADYSPEAEEVRSELLWKMRKWTQAAVALRRVSLAFDAKILSMQEQRDLLAKSMLVVGKDEELSSDDAEKIKAKNIAIQSQLIVMDDDISKVKEKLRVSALRLAIAQSSGENRQVLDSTHEKYQKYMDNTPFEKVFRLASFSFAGNSENLNKVQQAVDEVGIYRQVLGEAFS